MTLKKLLLLKKSQVLPNRKEFGGPPMTAHTVENEEAILNTV
jgi:hypothetical protein